MWTVSRAYHPRNKPQPGQRIDPSDPLAPSLVAFWPLNENSGLRALDVSGSEDYAAINASGGHADWSVGMTGPSLSLDGAATAVATGRAALNVGSTFSVIARVLKKTSGAQCIIGQGPAAATTFSYYLRIGSNAGFTAGVSSFRTVTTADLSLNVWHDVAMTYDGATLAYYVDGFLSASAANTGTPSVTTTPASIGSLGDVTSQNWNGMIDYVAIYQNRALSPQQVKAWVESPFQMFLPIRQRHSLASAGGFQPAWSKSANRLVSGGLWGG